MSVIICASSWHIDGTCGGDHDFSAGRWRGTMAAMAALRQRVDELVRLNRQQEPGGLACSPSETGEAPAGDHPMTRVINGRRSRLR
jgi:hypothetical protein